MAEDFIVPPKLEQVGNHTLAGIDIATLDDVASTCRWKWPVRAEEGPLGPIDESLEAREIEEIGAVEILSGTGIDDKTVNDRRLASLEAEMSAPLVGAQHCGLSRKRGGVRLRLRRRQTGDFDPGDRMVPALLCTLDEG